MDSRDITFSNSYDLINNILSDENTKNNCTDKIKEYEATLSSDSNKTELIRFSRLIALENCFNGENISSNTENILNELSSISSKDYSTDTDTILIMQLSNILDKFLSELSASEKRIYLYRYFFAYSIEDISKICDSHSQLVQDTLAKCNLKLKDLIQSIRLSTDSKSLLLSFTDIDNSHLLSIANNNVINKLSSKLNYVVQKNPKKTLALCLNIFFGFAILFFILLSIVQYTKNGSYIKLTPSAITNSNENDGIYIEVNGQKIVDGDKLLEEALYMENGGKYNFTTNINDYYVHYTAYNSTYPLDSLLGEQVDLITGDNETSYYKLLGNDSLEYIISEKGGKYLFYQSTYPYINDDNLNASSEIIVRYEQVISDFYGIKKWDDLEEIYVFPLDEFNGYADSRTKKLITDDLNKLYKILTNSAYKGMSVEEYADTNHLTLDYLYDNCVEVGIKGMNNVYIDKLFYFAEGNVFIDDYNSIILEAATDYGEKYLKEMFNINFHPVESSDPETWEYTLAWSSLNSTYIEYSILCGPNTDNHGKYVGSDFTLEKYKDGQWTAIPIHNEDIPAAPFKYKLNNDGSKTYITFFITDKYYALSSGKYRITITIYDSYSEDSENPAHRDFSAEFNLN